jgi:hypothetical protein
MRKKNDQEYNKIPHGTKIPQIRMNSRFASPATNRKRIMIQTTEAMSPPVVINRYFSLSFVALVKRYRHVYLRAV